MNHLIIWKDFRLFFGSHPRKIKEHSHPIIQLVIATQGKFLTKDEQANWRETTGLLIAPNQAHECDAKDNPIISVEIDPESNLGSWILKNQLKDRAIIEYPSEVLNTIEVDEFEEYLKREDWTAIRRMIGHTFDFSQGKHSKQKDQRIQKVLDFISNEIDQEITTEKLMAVSHLSESRLVHLFKEEMGLPIRNYILWLRIQLAFESILKGNSLTMAAHEAGFADQAHLTRTFSRMIGVPPSLVLKNSKFVQVSFPA